MSSKFFFDANTLIELVLDREGKVLVTDKLFAHSGNNYISTLSVHLAVHFGSKFSSLSVLEQLFSSFVVCDLTKDDVAWAFKNLRDEDFEDALQIAVAIRTGCDNFVTFDKKLAKNYGDLLEMDLLS